MAILTTSYAIFNSYNFNTVAGLSVLSIVAPGNQDRTLAINPVAHAYASKVSAGFYQNNSLDIQVYIAQSSIEARDNSISTLLQNIQSLEGTLVVPMSGVARQYTATYKNYTINEKAGGYILLTLHFLCSDSFGYDTTSQTIYNLTNQTASLNNYPYTQGGTADTQVPVFQVQLNTTPGTPSGSIIIGNSATGQAVTVPSLTTWAQFDLLLVDTKNKIVTINGTTAPFTGALPYFGLGSQTIYVQDTFTSRNYRFIAQVQNRYF